MQNSSSSKAHCILNKNFFESALKAAKTCSFKWQFSKNRRCWFSKRSKECQLSLSTSSIFSGDDGVCGKMNNFHIICKYLINHTRTYTTYTHHFNPKSSIYVRFSAYSRVEVTVDSPWKMK